MKTKNDFRLGLEVEGIYRHVEAEGGYRIENSEPLNDFWNTSEDSSLEEQGAEGQGVELISNVFKPSQLDEVLEMFKNGIINYRNDELRDCVVFNDSCGCHIHFSIPQTHTKDEFSYTINELMTERFFKKLNKLASKGKIRRELATLIKEHYYRYFSRKNSDRVERYQTINFCSNHNTVEWRSFNLLGVRTWNEMKELLTIAIQTIDEAITNRTKLPKIDINLEMED